MYSKEQLAGTMCTAYQSSFNAFDFGAEPIGINDVLTWCESVAEMNVWDILSWAMSDTGGRPYLNDSQIDGLTNWAYTSAVANHIPMLQIDKDTSSTVVRTQLTILNIGLNERSVNLTPALITYFRSIV